MKNQEYLNYERQRGKYSILEENRMMQTNLYKDQE